MFDRVYLSLETIGSLDTLIRSRGLLCTGPFVFIGHVWGDVLSGCHAVHSDLFERLRAAFDECVEMNLAGRFLVDFPQHMTGDPRSDVFWGWNMVGDREYDSHVLGLPCVSKEQALLDSNGVFDFVDALGLVDAQETMKLIDDLEKYSRA